LFFEAKSLKDSYEQMKLIMEEEAISDSSLELLQAGQISFTEYLVEIEMINSNRMRYIDYQKDLFTRLSALKAMVN